MSIIGWVDEPPPGRKRCSDWDEIAVAVRNAPDGRWAKLGPYGRDSVYQTARRMRAKYPDLEAVAHREMGRGFVYLRRRSAVIRPPGRDRPDVGDRVDDFGGHDLQRAGVEGGRETSVA